MKFVEYLLVLLDKLGFSVYNSVGLVKQMNGHEGLRITDVIRDVAQLGATCL